MIEDMVSLVGRAVESRMVADVPLGVFLSGGVDSSLIAAHAARLVGPELRPSASTTTSAPSRRPLPRTRRRGDRHAAPRIHPTERMTFEISHPASSARSTSRSPILPSSRSARCPSTPAGT